MRVMTLALLTPAALALLAGAPLAADAPGALPGAGARIRVAAAGVSPQRLTGTLEDVSPDTLILRLEDRDALVHVPREAITKLEVSRGRRSLGKSVLIGAGIGAAVGAILYNTCDRSGDDCNSTRQNLRSGAAMGSPVGAALGLLVGALGRERWQPVAAEQLRFSLAPTGRDGMALSVSVAF